MGLSEIKNWLWEGTRSSQTTSSGPGTSSQHHLLLTGIDGASAEAQSKYMNYQTTMKGFRKGATQLPLNPVFLRPLLCHLLPMKPKNQRLGLKAKPNINKREPKVVPDINNSTKPGTTSLDVTPLDALGRSNPLENGGLSSNFKNSISTTTPQSFKQAVKLTGSIKEVVNQANGRKQRVNLKKKKELTVNPADLPSESKSPTVTSQASTQKLGNDAPGGREVNSEALKKLELLWEKLQTTSQTNSGVGSNSQGSLIEAGTEARLANDQSNTCQNSIPNMAPQAFKHPVKLTGIFDQTVESCGVQLVDWNDTKPKILLIICRFFKSESQASSAKTSLVNRQLHPKMKPLVAESHGHVA
ncbi:hypothetical protein [Vampirovibrio sp.]|uniref:hypothetical protein n=1 Tax=Vampirovibrio sp. TaxID=2717857 RepID=UPI00359491F9